MSPAAFHAECERIRREAEIRFGDMPSTTRTRLIALDHAIACAEAEHRRAGMRLHR